ncbi:MAG: hypothetical protein ACLS69_02040 [Butyricicoccus sp.]
MQITPKACLSPAAAGIRGTSLIINLPGSPGARAKICRLLNPLSMEFISCRAGKSNEN